MKTVIRYSLFLLAMMVPMSELYAHSDGVHSGGWIQNLLHIMQNTDHLIIILAVGVVASFLVRDIIKKRR
ncbi:MAG: HupE/UreJ family protein [Gammaproteobacteria bacterium]